MPATALCYVLFFVASLVAPGLTGPGAGVPLVTPYSSDAQVAQYLATAGPGGTPVAAFCQAVSALALLAFVPYAARYVRRSAPNGAQAGFVLACGTTAAAFLLLSASAQWVLGRPGTGADLRVYRAVMDLTFTTGAAAQVATTGLLIGAIATAARASRTLPGWLTWLGLAVAVLSVLSVASLLAEPTTVLLPLGRYPGMVWFTGLAVTLLVRGAKRPA